MRGLTSHFYKCRALVPAGGQVGGQCEFRGLVCTFAGRNPVMAIAPIVWFCSKLVGRFGRESPATY
jgi:hypothetical protein